MSGDKLHATSSAEYSPIRQLILEYSMGGLEIDSRNTPALTIVKQHMPVMHDRGLSSRVI